MQPTPEYEAAERRRKAQREQAKAGRPKTTIHMPSYRGIELAEIMLVLCAAGCILAAVLCLGMGEENRIFCAAVLVCLGVWSAAFAIVLAPLRDIAGDVRAIRAVTTRLMELAQDRHRRDFSP